MSKYNKHSILCSAAALAITMSAGAALAQATTAVEPGPAEIDAVVVTGTRILRDGYAAPTPLAVVGAEAIEKQAGGNIASTLYTLPVFAGNTTAARTSNVPSSGTGGLNLLNIRGLGASRSLVLVDGARWVPTLVNQINAVDVSNIPQQLVSRVETVTGGASAVYGSDAVGGVTNFVLDNRFKGFKADVSGSVSQYGDGGAYRVDTAYGRSFLNDRLNVVASLLFADSSEIGDTTNRAWDNSGICVMGNPRYTATNGQPLQVTSLNCGGLTGAGGTINSGPLRGTGFGENGAQYQFIYGEISGALMRGGDYMRSQSLHMTDGYSMFPREGRQSFYGRATYDIAENLSVYFSTSYSHTHSNLRGSSVWKEAPPGITIRTDTAFIPANLRPALVGVSSFQYLTYMTDNWHIDTDNHRYTLRNIVGLDGSFGAFDTDWKWNAYYQTGLSRSSLRANSVNNVKLGKAVDAVSNASGQIVCRINQVTVTDPACTPFNLFGVGVNSQKAIDYTNDVGRLNQSNTQDVFSATITGEPFSVWAGPVSVAVNAEHRKETAYGSVNPAALNNELHSGNYKPINGELSVTEVAIEALVPLLNDVAIARSLDLELAARATEYSTSGSVSTWKVGLTYNPIDDLKLRANISRDIRAANLGELFAFGSAPTSGLVLLDPFTNVQTPIRYSATGNPNLAPEVAKTYGFGGVFSPSFLPGFQTSLDYWRVEISDVISSVGMLPLINLCFAGNAEACKGVVRAGPATLPGVGAYAGQMFAPIDQTIGFYVNLAKQTTDGVDWNLTYRFPLDSVFADMDGDISLNWNQSYYFDAAYQSGLPGGVTTYSDAFWRGLAAVTYSTPDLSVSVLGRFQSENIWTYASDPQVIECASSCPTIASLPSGTVTRDYVLREAAPHYDLNVTYTLPDAARTQLYLNIRNVLNTDPDRSPLQMQPMSYHSGVITDDTVGRYYRAGVRIKF